MPLRKPRLLWRALAATTGTLALVPTGVAGAEDVPSTSSAAGDVSQPGDGGDGDPGEVVQAPDDPTSQAVPGEYIVVLDEQEVAAADADRVASSKADEHGANVTHVYDHALTGFAAEMTAAEAQELAADPEVELVQENRTFTLRQEVQDDPPWGLDRIDQRDLPLNQQYRYSATGAGVDIYIVDSGIRTSHDDFGGRATVGADFVGDGQDGQDCDGHGSHVAGIAGGTTSGVAKGANLIAVRVADCGGSGHMANFLDAIDWIVENHDGPSVVNLSFGWSVGDDVTAEELAVQEAVGDGIVFAGATENTRRNGCDDDFPTRLDESITVSNSMQDDNINAGSGFGPCIDVYAPGTDIDSVGIADDEQIVPNTGTSMATPHVAGVAALYLEGNPSAAPAEIMDAIEADATSGRLTDSGGDLPGDTPNRLLFAPVQAEPPSADAGGPYSGDEGSAVSFDGTGSSDPSGGSLSYSWDFGDGSTGSGATPSHIYADNGQYTVTLTVSGAGGTDTAQTTATIDNVAPTVTIDAVPDVDEGGTLELTATFTDPGVLDQPFAADVDWGAPAGQAGEETQAPTVTVTDPGGGGEPLVGQVTAAYTYGDNDDTGFPISVTVTDKDDGTGDASASADVANVDPEVEITSETVTMGGVPTIVGTVDEPVDFSTLTTDPGSDDLTVAWDLDDGTTTSDESLVNPPDADPLPSPTVQPREVDGTVTHTYDEPCLYEATVSVTDDDGGTGSTTVMVLITGDGHKPKPALIWKLAYLDPIAEHFHEDTLQCYLDMANHASEVFSEEREVATFDDAVEVLKPSLLGGERTAAMDRQLLAAWLNFAHGAYDLDTPVDTDVDHEPDTPFWDVLQGAEDVRLDPTSTDHEIHQQTKLLERINEGCAPPDGLVDTLRCVALGLLPT